MNKMFKFIVAVAVGAVTLAASGADGSFAEMSKFVSKKANSLVYVDVTAFRGNKLIETGLDKIPDPDAAEIAAVVVKLMNVVDSVLLVGDSNSDAESVMLLVYGEKLADVAALETALKAALPAELCEDMSVDEIDGRKILRLDEEDSPGFVELEPGLFMLDDIEDISKNIAAEKGLNEQLSKRLASCTDGKAFAIFTMPVSEDVPPFMEYSTIKINPTGDDGVNIFNTIELGRGLRIYNSCNVNSVMIDKLVAHVMDWYHERMARAMSAADQDQSEDIEAEEIEIDEDAE